MEWRIVNPDFRFEPRLRASRVLLHINIHRGFERREGPLRRTTRNG